MSKPFRAVLRATDGTHIKNLSPDEAEVYEVYAEQGRVHRHTATKKGRATVIFRLKENCLPEAEPSTSPESHCMLTRGDMELLIVRGDIKLPRRLIERWIGHGLIPERRPRDGQHDLQRAPAFA